jgi:SsrA-binding protein
MAEKKPEIEVVTKNRRASFEYSILETYKCGMVLTGTEIKSIRLGKVNIGDAYCVIQNDELYVRNMHIVEYEKGGFVNHPTRADRKLLVKKTELKRLTNKLKDKGLTLIPLMVFLSENGFAKLEIALAKGKKSFDKREDIKKKDVQRETERRF